MDRARPGDGRRDPGGLSRTRPGDDGGRASGASKPSGASSPADAPVATRADRDLGPRRRRSPPGSHGARRSASSGSGVSQRRPVGPLRAGEPEAARFACPLGTRSFGRLSRSSVFECPSGPAREATWSWTMGRAIATRCPCTTERRPSCRMCTSVACAGLSISTTRSFGRTSEAAPRALSPPLSRERGAPPLARHDGRRHGDGGLVLLRSAGVPRSRSVMRH